MLILGYVLALVLAVVAVQLYRRVRAQARERLRLVAGLGRGGARAHGARRLGAMCVAVNTRFGPREVRDIVERSGAKFLITDLDDLDADAPEPPDQTDPEAPWMVFTSSGTT